jgi:hypothetical protein
MKYIFCLLILLIFGVPVIAQSSSSAKSEFEEWNEVDLIYALKQTKDAKGKAIDRITATVQLISRLGQNHLSEFVDSRAGLMLDFRVNKYAHLYTGYQYKTDDALPRTRAYEQRLNFALGLEKPFGSWTVKERNMYEHSFRVNRADTNRYRQRVQVSYSIKNKEKKEIIAPYVSEEGYLDLQTHGWVRNEFYAGFSHKFSSHYSADFFYVRLDTLPVNANGIGAALRIKLK